jgi:hypothetical protein
VRHRVGNGRAGHHSPAGAIRSPCFAGMKQSQGFYLSPDQEMPGATKLVGKNNLMYSRSSFSIFQLSFFICHCPKAISGEVWKNEKQQLENQKWKMECRIYFADELTNARQSEIAL